MDNNQDNQKKLDDIIKRLEKFEDKYTILTDEELGCPCCRVGRVIMMFEWCDKYRIEAFLKNKALKDKVQEWFENGAKGDGGVVLCSLFGMMLDLDDDVVKKALEDADDGITPLEELKKENEELKKENEELKKDDIEELKKENKELRKVVGWS